MPTQSYRLTGHSSVLGTSVTVVRIYLLAGWIVVELHRADSRLMRTDREGMGVGCRIGWEAFRSLEAASVCTSVFLDPS